MLQNQLLSRSQIYLLYIGFSVVYLSGLWIPLMENDSAQHATMAMRMVLNDDFLNIFKGENPYLDKPQMHFWLAALSMKFFGINAVAYRIPALLALVLLSFSTKKIADLLYQNENLGYLASLIFLSAQTIVLSAHDVRTDAVLTGFIAFSVWQFLKFLKFQTWQNAALAGLGTALAFSSKGLMAVVIIGFCVLAYLLYSREWKRFFNLKIFATLLAFLLGIMPVLYAFYHQFGTEGIRFILFNQSFNRLNAAGFEETSPDYFFFFHTLLWAFLPFSLLFYLGVFQKTTFFIKNRFRKIEGSEFLTLGGFWFVMLLFSASKFKLPHYLNGLIPIISVFTAAFIFEMYGKNQVKKAKILYIIQVVVIFAAIIGTALLTLYFTGITKPFLFVITALMFGFLVFLIFKKRNLFRKYVLVSLVFSVAINLFLNTQFYPVLTQYQGGLKLAESVNKKGINKEKIKMLKGNETWSFDFYTQRNTPRMHEADLKSGDFLVISKEQLNLLKRKFEIVDAENHFRITRLSLKFLNPEKRPSQLDKIYLIKITD